MLIHQDPQDDFLRHSAVLHVIPCKRRALRRLDLQSFVDIGGCDNIGPGVHGIYLGFFRGRTAMVDSLMSLLLRNQLTFIASQIIERFSGCLPGLFDPHKQVSSEQGIYVNFGAFCQLMCNSMLCGQGRNIVALRINSFSSVYFHGALFS
ncbi:hypothetical protein [Pseudoduganella lutea]|uniref:Uncharacterized protein n=1 Tax=Pseudoduganella lutea TaxID=321985 RepID=A0A4P6L3G5_9BURK|nr:hypothetical protein [Pseudoduganella lutea]QBE66120.1 hypothetical protein EWM63_26645 [Pseudoduganella lutea]